MTFPTFGEPVDPDYLAFKTGLVKAVADPDDKWRLRWDPASREWYRFSLDAWGFEDIGLADTSPEGAVRQSGWPIKYEVQSFGFPSLWERLEKSHNAYAVRYPRMRLVWSPWGGGDWRGAFKRAGSPPPAPPQPPPPRPPSARAMKQIREIEGWRDRGYISADQAQKMILAVIQADLADA